MRWNKSIMETDGGMVHLFGTVVQSQKTGIEEAA